MNGIMGCFFFCRLDLLRWWKIASRELTWFFFCLEDASVIGFTESCVLKIKLEVEINGLEEIWFGVGESEDLWTSSIGISVYLHNSDFKCSH